MVAAMMPGLLGPACGRLALQSFGASLLGPTSRLLLPLASQHSHGQPRCLSSSASPAAAAAALAAEAVAPPPAFINDAVRRIAPAHRFSPHAPRVKALLVDAAGTLLIPSESVTDVYLRAAARHGVVGLSEAEVLDNFRRAYNTPWGGSQLRYVDDARPFWRHIVSRSLGSSDEALFEEVYSYYSEARAWRLAPGAVAALTKLRAAGVKLAVCSNFDTRLRPVLAGLGVDQLFDAIIVSAEVGAEKPSPIIFEAAVQQLGVAPPECVHVGDDRRNDVWGGRDAGVTAWLWGSDVHTFDEVARRVLHMQRAGLTAWGLGDEDDD
ncbi:haloacid dehalogenase-like hydrolase domain-containing protein [Raphidocelis subcapitata]|uniref:Haloacid dehalogenase-like hydrolase domain-containing protein n=1 Tax=Raphidocelis subcapitata TaxID=307507 RepID=A0A2V0NSL0_9CHLO|nr:haloacid dehalogenase-like hydrolase domain-containing protein [Raphidocelis subcapitata]|eukprot:GBF87825.1 haloacid dehalogenase-like hydrolase domain-containing protein [Raphidocelis subcapitata]